MRCLVNGGERIVKLPHIRYEMNNLRTFCNNWKKQLWLEQSYEIGLSTTLIIVFTLWILQRPQCAAAQQRFRYRRSDELARIERSSKRPTSGNNFDVLSKPMLVLDLDDPAFRTYSRLVYKNLCHRKCYLSTTAESVVLITSVTVLVSVQVTGIGRIKWGIKALPVFVL